jgi:GT2 family glycosyltransferase
MSGYDELILVVNEGTGFGKAVNQGLRLAKGNYIAIVNNDIQFEEGSLKDLATDKIVSPLWGRKGGTGIGIDFLASCFCFPRVVYEKIGGFDERFNLGDYEDNDWYARAKEAGFEFEHNPKVRIYGKQGYTKSRMKNFSEVNKEKYLMKWGKLPEPFQETYYEV